jgi:hypothetical protein
MAYVEPDKRPLFARVAFAVLAGLISVPFAAVDPAL